MGDLISVRTEVVLGTLVESLAEAVARRLDEPLDDDVEAALAAASTPEHPLAARLARAGYLARLEEVARFEKARLPFELAGQPSELAAREPLSRPDPGDAGAATWRVPGPGGHVRHYLALRAIGNEGGDAARAAAADLGLSGPQALKRFWVYGFLVAARLT